MVVGLLVAIAGWRFTTMRQRTLKGFFLPRGLRIKWLGIDIKPPPRPTPPPTALELEATRRQRRAEERFQRRRTRGDAIGEGGQRTDANYDSDGEPTDDRADRESLPGYKADTSAPVYLEEWRENAAQDGIVPEIDEETADAIRRNGDVIMISTDAPDDNDRMLSVAEYEARIRGDADAPTRPALPSSASAVPIAAPADEQERQDDLGTQDMPRNPLAPMPAGVEALRRPDMARLPSSGPPIYADLSRQVSRNA